MSYGESLIERQMVEEAAASTRLDGETVSFPVILAKVSLEQELQEARAELLAAHSALELAAETVEELDEENQILAEEFDRNEKRIEQRTVRE